MNQASNAYIIAAQKINAICSSYSPICNFCGNVCDNHHWYRKSAPGHSLLREGEAAMKHFKEHNSIHETLKTLTSSYLICKECFDLGNYPKILSAEDFQKEDLRSILEITSLKPEQPEGGDAEMKDEAKDEWTQEEMEMLVEGVVNFQNDWDKISKEIFRETRSGDQCVLKFLELPLTENMMARIYNSAKAV